MLGLIAGVEVALLFLLLLQGWEHSKVAAGKVPK